MAEARELMDRVTDAMVAGRRDELRDCYADDAVVVSPEADEIRGAGAVVDYLRSFTDAFPDRTWEEIAKHEAGDAAIDEGYFCGTNSGPLQMPSGDTVPPTGKRVRLRECDVVTVKNGRITSH